MQSRRDGWGQTEETEETEALGRKEDKLFQLNVKSKTDPPPSKENVSHQRSTSCD